jgi:Tfp pilus assembly protein PilF
VPLFFGVFAPLHEILIHYLKNSLFPEENPMVRWLNVMFLAVSLTLGGVTPGMAAEGSEKVKAYDEKAAQDYYKYGLILAEEGHHAQAAKAFRDAIGIKPNWAEAHSLLGSALAKSGDLSEAEKELRLAVKLKPDYAEGWNYLGEFLKEHGKQQEAEEAFAKAKQFSRRP